MNIKIQEAKITVMFFLEDQVYFNKILFLNHEDIY